ncbi:hypothetical protein [Streptomyces sp. NPDC008137]|uniref:hypothetical protein n=1 Tax=Streptomyces sp. NPDC008137 TaxID=3364813 RepID=UPI0036F103E3
MDPDRLIAAAPALLFGAVLVISGVWAIRHAVRGGENRSRSRVPTAPDNLPPTDIDALITCRRINALPTARKEKP